MSDHDIRTYFWLASVQLLSRVPYTTGTCMFLTFFCHVTILGGNTPIKMSHNPRNRDYFSTENYCHCDFNEFHVLV